MDSLNLRNIAVVCGAIAVLWAIFYVIVSQAGNVLGTGLCAGLVIGTVLFLIGKAFGGFFYKG